MAAERQEHDEISPWWGEHIHRYVWAQTFTHINAKILDLACGNGFGTILLSKKTTNKVIGGDLSKEAIQYCSDRFKGNSNIRFLVIDGTNSGLESGSIDLITSFETIEHTTKYNDMLHEFKRILNDQGQLILSTPNIIINSPDGIVKNPFHTQEFQYNELLTILNAIFNEVKIYGQKYIRYEKQSLKNRLAKSVESILYTRGIRKIPIQIQNRIMQFIIKKDMYPTIEDYQMVEGENEIIKCKTFVVVCKKK